MRESVWSVRGKCDYGILHRGERAQACPFTLNGYCGEKCPQFAVQDHPMVIGDPKIEAKLFCTNRTIVLEGGRRDA